MRREQKILTVYLYKISDVDIFFFLFRSQHFKPHVALGCKFNYSDATNTLKTRLDHDFRALPAGAPHPATPIIPSR